MKAIFAGSLLCCAMALTGCYHMASGGEGACMESADMCKATMAMAPMAAPASSNYAMKAMRATATGASNTTITSERMILWTGTLRVETKTFDTTSTNATDIIMASGARIQEKSAADDYCTYIVKVAPEKLAPLMEQLRVLGKVLSSELSSEDVTERWVDNEARLKNNYALRDRLRLLLADAKAVNDVLSVERELNRVQSAIDSQEGIQKSLLARAKESTLTFTLSKRPEKEVDPEEEVVLGPLGWVCYGTWWTVRKLFIWSDGE